MTWELIIRSFAVLRQDRKLVVFPAISGLAGLLLVALCFYSPWSRTLIPGVAENRITFGGFVVLFLCYCLFNFVVVFCNCALAACAQIRFNGNEPRLSDGFHRAASRIRPIALWAILSASVGVLLQFIIERVGFLGKVVTWLIGFSWALVTYLIVPVLVIEELDVHQSIRRSTRLLRHTWGEQLVVSISLGWVVVLFAIPGVILGVLGHVYSFGLVPALLYFVLLMAAITCLENIFEVALYRYAATGEAAGTFTSDMLRVAFRRSE